MPFTLPFPVTVTSAAESIFPIVLPRTVSITEPSPSFVMLTLSIFVFPETLISAGASTLSPPTFVSSSTVSLASFPAMFTSSTIVFPPSFTSAPSLIPTLSTTELPIVTSAGESIFSSPSVVLFISTGTSSLTTSSPISPPSMTTLSIPSAISTAETAPPSMTTLTAPSTFAIVIFPALAEFRCIELTPPPRTSRRPPISTLFSHTSPSPTPSPMMTSPLTVMFSRTTSGELTITEPSASCE